MRSHPGKCRPFVCRDQLSRESSRHQLQAARPQDVGVSPCGSPALRGRRFATGSNMIRDSFVKGGDGLADLNRSRTLYRRRCISGGYCACPEHTSRRPTTDTYSLPQTQESSTSASSGDLDLFCTRQPRVVREKAQVSIGLCRAGRARVRGIDQNASTTAYLHTTSLLVEPCRNRHQD